MSHQYSPVDMTVAADLQLDAPLHKDSLLVFYRTISALLSSGQNSAESFRLAGEYSADPNMKAAALGVYDELARRGKTLPEAIAKYPNMFSDLNKGLIATGDQIGALDKVFARIADAEEALDVTRRRIKLALLYPSVIVIGVLITLLLSPRLFVNHIRTFVTDMGMEMPAFSKAVFAFSDLTVSPLVWIAAIALVAFLRWRWELLFRRDQMKARFFRVCYRCGPVATVVRALTQAHWARIMALQLEAGTKVTLGLATIKQSLRDPVFKEANQTILDALERGATIAQGMEQSNYFDPVVVGVVAVGEEVGSLAPLLDFVARTYEDEFQMRLEMFEQMITPSLMIFCGTIVGVWAVATLLPMGQLISGLAAG